MACDWSRADGMIKRYESEATPKYIVDTLYLFSVDERTPCLHICCRSQEGKAWRGYLSSKLDAKLMKLKHEPRKCGEIPVNSFSGPVGCKSKSRMALEDGS